MAINGHSVMSACLCDVYACASVSVRVRTEA
jgi:hypothetical protein